MLSPRRRCRRRRGSIRRQRLRPEQRRLDYELVRRQSRRRWRWSLVRGTRLRNRRDNPRLRRGGLVLCIVLALAPCAMFLTSAFAGIASPQRTTVAVIRGDVQIGHFLVRRDGTLDGAIRAFGRPTSVR